MFVHVYVPTLAGETTWNIAITKCFTALHHKNFAYEHSNFMYAAFIFTPKFKCDY